MGTNSLTMAKLLTVTRTVYKIADHFMLRGGGGRSGMFFSSIIWKKIKKTYFIYNFHKITQHKTNYYYFSVFLIASFCN